MYCIRQKSSTYLQYMHVQAFGARQFQELAVIFQRTIAWLLLHCVPVSLLFVALPWLLRAIGQPAELCSQVDVYVICLLPTMFLNALISYVANLHLALPTVGSFIDVVPFAVTGGCLSSGSPQVIINDRSTL